ncbi:MAG TPA: hypothetical protein VI451_15050, partial [Anaerolineales bacterium]|nr:hypothetical protein [Anaerolineales bacterium]
MERIYQPVDEKGLQIPLALVQKYGLDKGADAVLELGPDGIRISPAHPDQPFIERRALKYLLTSVGDGARVKVKSLPAQMGWEVNVFGIGMNKPSGKLIYNAEGELIREQSTTPEEIRRTTL